MAGGERTGNGFLSVSARGSHGWYIESVVSDGASETRPNTTVWSLRCYWIFLGLIQPSVLVGGCLARCSWLQWRIIRPNCMFDDLDFIWSDFGRRHHRSC